MNGLAQKVGVEIQNLSSNAIQRIENSSHGQKRTSKNKKTVYVVDGLIFKGPYKDNEKALIRNLKNNYALKIFEDILELEEKKRSTLKWEFIGYDGNDHYYLVSKNVGNCNEMEVKRETSRIENDVPIIQRGTMVYRVSDIEETHQLTTDIKVASLQHLYLRFLLNIGDSGTHNILLRSDGERNGRLVAGIDLEENRVMKPKKIPDDHIDHLFSKDHSKKRRIYQSSVGDIEPLKYGRINRKIKAKLENVGIDLNVIYEKTKIWSTLP